MSNTLNQLTRAKRAVVAVGAGGRGFIVGGPDRLVITAAHCLPSYPEPHLANGPELIYPRIIGPLTFSQRPIWGELVSCSLVDDLAVLGAPEVFASELESEVDGDPFMRFSEFTEEHAIRIGQSPEPAPLGNDDGPGSQAFVLSLEGEWQTCTVRSDPGSRFVFIAGARIESGMSGSPILNADGEAIGLISTSGASGSVNPSLTDCLPPWLLRKLLHNAIAQETL
jgi:hypothetical protein